MKIQKLPGLLKKIVEGIGEYWGETSVLVWPYADSWTYGSLWSSEFCYSHKSIFEHAALIKEDIN